MLTYLKYLYRAYRYRFGQDHAEVHYLVEHIHSGDTVLDIGAHKGAYTHWMYWAVGPQGKVIAFEPQPKLFAYLSRVYKKVANVTIEWLALSDQVGQGDLFTPKGGTSPSASLNPHHEDLKSSGPTESHSIATTTLTDYVQDNNLPPIKFIKCDVEGHEFSVFKGAETILKRDKPRLLFECEARHRGDSSIQEVFNYLKGLGYQGYFMCHGAKHPVEDFDPAQHQISFDQTYVNNFIFE